MMPTMELEEIIFSGWTAIEEKKLHASEKPKDEKVYTMYHGTYLKNVQGIITSGFQRSSDGMLGPGVYVSRNIDKAKCYPLKADKKEAIVLKLKVRVGKVKKIDIDNHPLQKSWHQNGYDSCWVPPNCGVTAIKSGREEDCVWDPARIVVVDVACCLDDKTRWDLRKKIRGMNSHGAKDGCNQCHQNTSNTGSHPIQSCWECTEQICPFQKKHVCNK
uniref:Grass carp reovirus (GCRV)-induced gene 2o n=1 Tax=Hucho hucho TaxID=62062 RepID=A0A4W5MW72_9TELE